MKAVKLLSVVLMAALFAVVSVTGTAVAAKTIKMHHLNKDDPFDNPTGAMATVFKSLVEAGTNGSVIVQTFPSGQLGKDKDALQQVKAGVIQAGIHSVGGFASVYPLIGILDIPFAFSNISKTYEVFDGPFGKKLAADIEKKTGLHVLGFGDSGGFFQLTNSKRPIHSPADMAGVKIRTMGLDTHKAMIPIIAFAKFQEVQKYLTLSGHIFAPYVWTMNAKFWNSLSDNEKYVINYAAESAIVAGRGMGRIIEASDRGLKELSKTMKVNTLTAAEKEAFRIVAVPAVEKLIIEKFGAEGEEMLNAFLEAIK